MYNKKINRLNTIIAILQERRNINAAGLKTMNEMFALEDDKESMTCKAIQSYIMGVNRELFIIDKDIKQKEVERHKLIKKQLGSYTVVFVVVCIVILIYLWSTS